MRGLCARCLEIKRLTRHHIYPRQFFKKSPIIYLCEECHNTLHQMYPRLKVSKYFYLELVQEFILGGKMAEKWKQ